MTKEPHAWTLSLRNTGQLKQSLQVNTQTAALNASRTGLVNLRQRLKLLFGTEARVDLQQQQAMLPL